MEFCPRLLPIQCIRQWSMAGLDAPQRLLHPLAAVSPPCCGRKNRRVLRFLQKVHWGLLPLVGCDFDDNESSYVPRSFYSDSAQASFRRIILRTLSESFSPRTPHLFVFFTSSQVSQAPFGFFPLLCCARHLLSRSLPPSPPRPQFLSRAADAPKASVSCLGSSFMPIGRSAFSVKQKAHPTCSMMSFFVHYENGMWMCCTVHRCGNPPPGNTGARRSRRARQGQGTPRRHLPRTARQCGRLAAEARGTAKMARRASAEGAAAFAVAGSWPGRWLRNQQ